MSRRTTTTVAISGDIHQLARQLRTMAETLEAHGTSDNLLCPIDGEECDLYLFFEEADDSPELGTLAQIEYSV